MDRRKSFLDFLPFLQNRNKTKHRFTVEKRYWFRRVFQIHSSVIPGIFPRIIVFCIISLCISIAYYFKLPVSLSSQTSIVSSLVLGLLLVFRTNTAYEKFWEGRKQWGILNNSVRNLSRQIWVGVAEENESDRQEKIIAIKLLVAYAVAMKLHLRGEPLNQELAELVPVDYYKILESVNNRPLKIAFWIGDYIKKQTDRDRLELGDSFSMLNLLNAMVDTLGGCERIVRTPIPLAYSIHLKQLLFLYCFLLPLQIVAEFQWGTPIVVGLVAFTVFGIEEIGIEIEDPFGHDPNDLPLDAICQAMTTTIEDLITLTPSVGYDQ